MVKVPMIILYEFIFIVGLIILGHCRYQLIKVYLHNGEGKSGWYRVKQISCVPVSRNAFFYGRTRWKKFNKSKMKA